MSEKKYKEGDRQKRKDEFGRDEFFVYSEALDTWLPQNAYLDMFPIAPEDIPEDIGSKERNIGLVQRAGIQGITQGALAVPAFIGDVIFGATPIAMRQALGDERGYTQEELTPFTSSLRYGSERLADVFGKPRPVTPGEQRLVEYGGAGVGGFSGAALSKLLGRIIPTGTKTAAALEELGTSPGTQATAAVTGMGGAEILPQLAPGADENLRNALSVGGGILGSLAGGTVSGLTSGVSRAAVSPFTREGREIDVGTLMRSMSLNPEQSIFEMRRGVPSVKGVTPLTADVARDPGLAGLEIGVRSTSDVSNRIAGQRLGNLQVLRSEMDRLARTAGPEDRTAVIERMKEVRAELTNPMREQAFSAMNRNVIPASARTGINLVLGRELDNIAASSRGGGEGAQSVINWTKGRINDAILDPKIKGDFFRRLYEIRKDLREKTLAPSTDEQTRAFKSGAPVAEDIIRTIDDILDNAAGGNKAWNDYLDNFAQSSRRIERIGLLQDIQARSLGTVEDIESRQFLLSAPKMAQVLRSRQTEIDETLTRVQKERLNAIMRDLQAGASTTAPQVRPPTSGTIKNLTMANFIARTLGGNAAENPAIQTLFRPLQWLTKIPQEQAEELLIDAMLDPKLGALLMHKADPKNVATFGDAMRDSYRATLYQAPASGLLSGGR